MTGSAAPTNAGPAQAGPAATDPLHGSGHGLGDVLARIRSLAPSLLPAERDVAQTLLARPGEAIEWSSQQLADASATSRTTVVRTCQRLGYSGYQQLRVMLARDVGSLATSGTADTSQPQTAAGAVTAAFAAFAAAAPSMTALLDAEQLTAAVRVLARAQHIVAIGNGLSAAVAEQAAQRLAAIGCWATAPVDSLQQQVIAGHLGPSDALLVISGSGANAATIRAAAVARATGATVLLVTAFARSALIDQADHTLIVGMRNTTFLDELTVTTRIPQFILVEALAAAVARELGPTASAARARAMAIIADNLAE